MQCLDLGDRFSNHFEHVWLRPEFQLTIRLLPYIAAGIESFEFPCGLSDSHPGASLQELLENACVNKQKNPPRDWHL